MLTDAQQDWLVMIRDFHIGTQNSDKRTIKALQSRGLIAFEGLHFTGKWVLTDAGLEALSDIDTQGSQVWLRVRGQEMVS
jgi:hypothetical protein